MSSPRLSVIVSSHNRASKLRGLLGSLGACDVPDGLAWEVIAVDNASDDETRDVVASFADAASPTFHYHYQSTKVKARGLNIGVRAARGEWLAFLDDDVRVARDWVAYLWRCYAEEPDLAGLGGRIEPYRASTSAVATRTSKRVRWLGDGPFPLGDSPIIGCNMSFRRSVVEDLGGFDERFGPGSVVGSGDDVDFLYRAYRAGHRVRYDPDLVVYHDHGRQSAGAIERTNRRYLRGRGGFYLKHGPSDRQIAKSAYWEVHRSFRELTRGALGGSLDRNAIGALGLLASGALAFLRSRRR